MILANGIHRKLGWVKEETRMMFWSGNGVGEEDPETTVVRCIVVLQEQRMDRAS